MFLSSDWLVSTNHFLFCFVFISFALLTAVGSLLCSLAGLFMSKMHNLPVSGIELNLPLNPSK